MNVGIILAGGEGSRLGLPDRNKTTLEISGKPLVQYGVELYQGILDATIIVIGAHSESVKQAVHGDSVFFVEQKERLGTGHAAMIGLEEIHRQNFTPKTVVLGYGDHMMFYTRDILREFIAEHEAKNAAVSLISTHHENPDELAWARIIRDENGHIVKTVEQKDASQEERLVTELNAGLYCVEYTFFVDSMARLQPSPVSKEYYLPDVIGMAVDQGKTVLAQAIPFEFVGVGINTKEQFAEAQALLAARENQ